MKIWMSWLKRLVSSLPKWYHVVSPMDIFLTSKFLTVRDHTENREIIYRTKGIARAEPLNLEGEIRLVGVPIIFSMSDIVLFVGRYSVNCHLVSVPSQLAVISSFKRQVISSFKEWILCSAWSSKSPKNRNLSPPQTWNLRLKKQFMARV